MASPSLYVLARGRTITITPLATTYVSQAGVAGVQIISGPTTYGPFSVDREFTVDGQASVTMADYTTELAAFRRHARVVTVPSAIATAWTLSQWEPQTVTLYESGTDPHGDVGITPEALFDLFSTARSAPANTYYVDVATGNDSTGDGTSGNKWKSIHKIVTAANATGSPAMGIITAGNYPKANNPSNANAVLPTVDIAYIATGGRVVCGTWDDFSAPSADGTQANTYSYSVSNVNRVSDRKVLDRFGNYTDLTLVGSAAICNITPNSYYTDGSTLYIRRGDGAAVTNSNTRVFRSTVGNVKITSPVSVFFGGATAADGFDFEGGNSTGVLHYGPSSTPATNKAVVASNCSFKYAGGANETSATAVAINSVHGIAAFFNCRADGDWTDGFNCHNTTSATAVPHFMTVNCSGTDNGRGAAQSCNGFTVHEDVTALDVAGVYRNNRGGTVRCINTSKTFLAGTVIVNDLGDIAQGGSIAPTAIRTDDTATIYADGVVIDMPAGSLALHAGSGTAIYHRNLTPLRCANRATGTIGTY